MSDMPIVDFHLSLSTAQLESAYFSGYDQVNTALEREPDDLPEGVYRVVDGELYRLVAGAPPELAPEPHELDSHPL